MSVNKVILVGNLGADPEVRQFDNGGMIATIRLATSERWTDRNTGQRQEHTEWHRVIFNNRQAEIAQQYLRKGSKIYVEGSIRTRKWTDQQTGQERYATEIRADSFQMLDSRGANDGGQPYYNNQNQGFGGGNNYGQNQGYQNQGYGQQGFNQGNGGYQAPPSPAYNQNQFGNQSFGGNNAGFAPQGNFPQAAPQQNDMAQNNSFGAPAAAPQAKPTTPPPAAAPVITPAEPSGVTDDDIPF